jgi:DinB superfamily
VAATVREAINELIASTQATVDVLLDAGNGELSEASSHVCAQGKDAWTLITNEIDHEKIHQAQVIEGRYELGRSAEPMERLVAEWFEARARLIGSFIGMSDEEFNRETAPDAWTYRQLVKHVLLVEQDALRTLRADREARAEAVAAPSL